MHVKCAGVSPLKMIAWLPVPKMELFSCGESYKRVCFYPNQNVMWLTLTKMFLCVYLTSQQESETLKNGPRFKSHFSVSLSKTWLYLYPLLTNLPNADFSLSFKVYIPLLWKRLLLDSRNNLIEYLVCRLSVLLPFQETDILSVAFWENISPQNEIKNFVFMNENLTFRRQD